MKILFLFPLILLLATNLVAQDAPTPLAEKRFAPEQLLQDFDSAYVWMHENHPNLHLVTNKKTADKAWATARKKITAPMTRFEFARLIFPLTSQYMDGHAGLGFTLQEEEFTQYAATGKFFPFKIKIIDKRLYVANELEGSKVQRGAELVRINGLETEKMLPELLQLWPGDSKAHQEATLTRLFGATLWYAYGWGNSVDVAFRNPGEKKIRTEKTAGVSLETLYTYIFPGGNRQHRLFLYEQESLAVIEYYAYRSRKEAAVFLDSAFSVIKEKNIRTVALDLRNNGGGSSSVGDEVLKYITRKPYTQSHIKELLSEQPLVLKPYNRNFHSMLQSLKEESVPNASDRYRWETAPYVHDAPGNPALQFNGAFYLLTSSVTFSSAHMTAAAVKAYQLGTIVGQPTGSRLNFTGEPLLFVLPNTALEGMCPGAQYFLPGYQEGNALQPVVPDVSIPLSPQALAQGQDTVLEYVKAQAKVRPQ